MGIAIPPPLGDTWMWGRQVFCLPKDGSAVSVGSTVQCFFREDAGAQLAGWNTNGFAERQSIEADPVSHTTAPGNATVTVNWFDSNGPQAQSLHYTITPPAP